MKKKVTKPTYEELEQALSVFVPKFSPKEKLFCVDHRAKKVECVDVESCVTRTVIETTQSLEEPLKDVESLVVRHYYICKTKGKNSSGETVLLEEDSLTRSIELEGDSLTRSFVDAAVILANIIG